MATQDPDLLRFWMGHGLSRAQIRMDTRERQFFEELGQDDQDYPSAIRELEYDELGGLPADRRLFVLTGLQKKANPLVLARIQYLKVENPATPFELDAVSIAPPFGSTEDYDILSIELIPEEKLLLAIGNAVNPATGVPVKLLIQLYRYGATSPGGPDELVLIEELLENPMPLKDCLTVTDRRVLKLFEGEAHPLDGVWHAFIEAGTGLVNPPQEFFNKPLVRGVVVCRVDADAPLGQRLTLYQQGLVDTDANFVYDPAWDYACGLQKNCSEVPSFTSDITVNAFDFVDDATPGSSKEFIYMACGRLSQVLQFEIQGYTTNGFTEQKKLDLVVQQGSAPAYSDNLFDITTRHDPAKDVDLLYVVGQQFLHVA